MQRVALGRAIVKNVPLFLMDEPLSNLDAKLRLVMRSEIVKLHNLINATTIYVTHDQTEAMTMASRIVVMSRGFVQQIGTPNEVYDNPANLFVAKFIGSPSINIFDGVYKDGTVTFDRASIKLDNDLIARHDDFYAKTLEEFENINVDFDRESSEYILKILSALNDEKKVVEKQVKPHFFTRFISLFKKNKEEENHISFSREQDVCLKMIEDLKQIEGNEHSLLFAVRPEKLKIRVLEDGDNKLADNEIEVTVTVSELLGSEYHVHFDYAGHDMVAKFSKEERKVSMGDRLAISFDIKDVFIFDPITGGRIY
jgi:ABC-type sugar transport system ATPase subunit